MKGWRQIVSAIALVLAPAAALAADEATAVKPETTALYRTAREQVDRLGTTPAAKYAPEAIERAKQSLAAAQSGLEAGNDQATRAGAERAVLQSKLALALADERIAAEKTVATRNELDRLTQRLNAILAGKGE